MVYDCCLKTKPLASCQHIAGAFQPPGETGPQYSKKMNDKEYTIDTDATIVAQRGRESRVLTPRRTEYGKAVRKAYEARKLTEQRKNIQRLKPR